MTRKNDRLRAALGPWLAKLDQAKKIQNRLQTGKPPVEDDDTVRHKELKSGPAVKSTTLLLPGQSSKSSLEDQVREQAAAIQKLQEIVAALEARLAKQIGRAVQQECRDRSRMPSSA
eukprot:TRINITY_DN12040_c0_g1_i6.p1 TRINITY_DN12040_c0_g1~~TRINITY_DN12040_c0_g1_i6.p1  ORF type:complete len:117 (-),score=21.78 TRINITY_DN12040_c0_g1_i6:17-367(-)